MKPGNFVISICALLGLLLFASTGLGQTDSAFAKANDEYGKGQFQDAIGSYEALSHSGQWSAALFYDLGNAYFRIADFGRAILNYERALALEPHQPETTANLALARDEARALELQKTRSDTVLRFATTNQLTVAAAISFWVTAFLFMAMIWSRRRSLLRVLLSIVALLIGLLSAGAIYRLEAANKTVAIVVGPDVQARLATADNAGSVLRLPPGSEIRILSRRGDWVYAMLPNNLQGWIPTKSVEPVRL